MGTESDRMVSGREGAHSAMARMVVKRERRWTSEHCWAALVDDLASA